MSYICGQDHGASHTGSQMRWIQQDQLSMGLHQGHTKGRSSALKLSRKCITASGRAASMPSLSW